MISPARRLRDLTHQVGWRRLLWVAPRWLLAARYEVWCFEHGVDRRYPEVREVPGLVWTRIPPATADDALAVNPQLTRREIERRLGEGVEAWLARRDGRPVHVHWSAFDDHDLPYLGLRFRASAGDHVSGGAYTVPEERGRGLQGLGLARVLRDAGDRGARRTLALIATWNVASRRTLQRCGWRGPVGIVGRRAFGRPRLLATGAVELVDGGFRVARDA